MTIFDLASEPRALIGYGLGCASGYIFAMVTSRREAKRLTDKLLADRDDRIASLEAKVSALENIIFNGVAT